MGCGRRSLSPGLGRRAATREEQRSVALSGGGCVCAALRSWRVFPVRRLDPPAPAAALPPCTGSAGACGFTTTRRCKRLSVTGAPCAASISWTLGSPPPPRWASTAGGEWSGAGRLAGLGANAEWVHEGGESWGWGGLRKRRGVVAPRRFRPEGRSCTHPCGGCHTTQECHSTRRSDTGVGVEVLVTPEPFKRKNKQPANSAAKRPGSLVPFKEGVGSSRVQTPRENLAPEVGEHSRNRAGAPWPGRRSQNPAPPEAQRPKRLVTTPGSSSPAPRHSRRETPQILGAMNYSATVCFGQGWTSTTRPSTGVY